MIENKKIALSFLEMATQGKIRQAYERFMASDFIHHNQYFKGDRSTLLHAMEESYATNPNTHLSVKQAHEVKDTVITYSHVTGHEAHPAGIAVVHIFRFEKEHIVELWDVGQVILEDSPNENGLF